MLERFEEFQRGIGFVYLKTSRDLPPARLEIPLWVYQAGLLDEVVDLMVKEVERACSTRS